LPEIGGAGQWQYSPCLQRSTIKIVLPGVSVIRDLFVGFAGVSEGLFRISKPAGRWLPKLPGAVVPSLPGIPWQFIIPFNPWQGVIGPDMVRGRNRIGPIKTAH